MNIQYSLLIFSVIAAAIWENGAEITFHEEGFISWTYLTDLT